MKKYRLLLLICIVAIAAALRLFNLNTVPSALYWEEAALGYDAYSIARTGKDYHGNPMPVVAFTSFGDYKPPLYFYATSPFVQTFGLNEWSVRLPSALAGIATVVVVFLIAEALYGTTVGLLAGTFLAIQPWAMHLSRVGFETNLASLLVALGVLLLIKAKRRPWVMVAAAVSLVLSMYAYHSERVVAPILALVLIIAWRQFRHLKWVLVSGGVAFVLLLPILMNLRNPAVTQRAAETSIFSDLEPIQQSNAMRESSGDNLLSRILYHRYVFFAEKILVQYTKNFSLSFLFLDGDENIRHGTKEFGLLYPWELFCILPAVFLLLRNRKKNSLLPLLWIAVAALPVALTTASPHTLRFAAASPAFAILTGYGLYSISTQIRRSFHAVFTITITLVIIGCSLVYLHFYHTHYPSLSAESWQYGYKELFLQLSQHKTDGQKVYVTREQGRPSIYYLFFNNIDPRSVQAQDAQLPKDQQELLQVDDYYFVDKLEAESGSLVASSPERRPADIVELSNISLPNGTVIWSIWERP